jgi:hypothetical protein
MADLKISVDMTDIPAAVQATQRFERQINTLASQLARGSITTGTYQKGLQQLSRQYAKLGVDVNTAKSSIMSYGRAAAEAARAQQAMFAASQASSAGINRMGVGMQQAGYQVGDFLVQVQSGTNAFVAFGQQATQLVGILPMFNSVMGISGTRLIALSAGLGIAIPLITAVAAALMRTRKSAEDSSAGLETLEDRMRSARAEMQGFTRDIEMYRRGIKDLGEFALVEGIEEARDRVRELSLEIQELEQMGTITAPNERELATARELLAARQAELETYIKSRRESELLGAAEERRVEAIRLYFEYAQRDAELIEQRNRGVREILATVEEERKTLLERTRLSQLEIQYGRESSQYRQAQADVEERIYRLQLSQNGILGNNQEEMIRLWKEAGTVADEAQRIEDAIKQVQATNLNTFNDQVRMLATLLGTSADEAARLLSNMPVGMTFGNTGALSSYSGEELLPPARRQPRGGGASGPNAVERLQQEIAFRQRILNLSQEERDLQTEIFRITNALGKDRNKYSSDFIANLAQQNLAIQEQERVIEDARKQQEQLADSIANSFGDAFMSMVDGTKSAKDAFRSMAADIIRELYRVLVVQRMVNSISGALGPGGSAGGFLSSLFGGRESGGSMMAGRPYLVGERGPELVIPGRSSTVTNADLTRKSMGGSDAVNVVNNINVTGGTDPAAIRQEVAKLMPQITNATKSAVIDARRRGGQMKAAFG